MTNAASYQVFRSTDSHNYSQIGSPTANSFSDFSVAADTTYIYQIAAVDPSSNISGMSARDLATTIVFTDDPLLTGSVIKAIHLTQLRTAVTAVIIASGNNAYYTYANSIAPGASITADQMNELRDNLVGARFFIGSLPNMNVTFSDDRIAKDVTKLRAAHIRELRRAVK